MSASRPGLSANALYYASVLIPAVPFAIGIRGLFDAHGAAADAALPLAASDSKSAFAFVLFTAYRNVVAGALPIYFTVMGDRYAAGIVNAVGWTVPLFDFVVAYNYGQRDKAWGHLLGAAMVLPLAYFQLTSGGRVKAA